MTKSVAGWIAGRKIKYVIVAFWLAVVALAGPLAGKLTTVEANDAKSWLPGSAESTKVLDSQSAFVAPDTAMAVIVYERATGLTPADQAKIASDVQAYGHLPELGGRVSGPVPAKDGQAAAVYVPVNLGNGGWATAPGVVDAVRATAEGGANGLTVHVAGPAAAAADSSAAFKGIDGVLLYSTIAVVVVILLFTYRSPGLWLLPVLSAGVALTVAESIVYLLAKHAGLTVNAQSAGILTVLVFGAGTDYALLLVARYREELRRHEDRHEAMAFALHRAGPAIVASAATVVIGMLCLLFAETNSTKGLGPVAAAGIAVGLAVMLTLLPAMLVICGRWIFWPVRPRYGTPEPTQTGLWARVGNAMAARPRLTWIGTALALAAVAVGMVQLDANGLSEKESFRGTQPSVVAGEALARHFPAGAGTPVLVVSRAEQVAAVRSALAGTPGIDPDTVSPPQVQGDRAFLQAAVTAAPDSAAAFATVDRVRQRVHAVSGAEAMVGGNSAVQLDIQRAARHDRNIIIPVVLAVVFLILALLLRAIVAPILLIGTVVLSFAAALGASALVFRHVFGYGGADTSFPLFVFVFLVALGIDYNIFLMTRVREEAVRHGTRRGALIGLAATGGVITSAGLVLAGTFAVLGTLPLVAFAEIGFAVAFGVLLDTIVVRSVLVTALNLDLGSTVWWPSRLAREEPAHREADSVAGAPARPSSLPASR